MSSAHPFDVAGKAYSGSVFRLVYREHLCRDCHEPNAWPICSCGCMRPLSDEFSVIDEGTSYEWTARGAVPRVPFDSFERAQIRDAILVHGSEHLSEIVTEMIAKLVGWPGPWPWIE